MTLKFIVTGPNILLIASNGDRSGYTPDINNEIVISELSVDSQVTVDPSSTDRITATVIQSTE